MKKIFSTILILSICLSLVSCGSSFSGTVRLESLSPTVNDVLEEKTSTDGQTTTEETIELPADHESLGVSSYDLSIDIDLTTMNSNMVYSQVYDMVVNPNDYLGQVVKMAGQFAIYDGEERIYFACLVADATACCAQGIEFLLRDDRSYPDEYPDLGSDITVIGIFDPYTETLGGQEVMYIQLSDAIISF
ncbi:MAG: hypothetical protein IJ091_05860 [Oscillospiraceae bacterium]|nr:hypothetical protein [Oscillospiraceae bacterium]